MQSWLILSKNPPFLSISCTESVLKEKWNIATLKIYNDSNHLNHHLSAPNLPPCKNLYFLYVQDNYWWNLLHFLPFFAFYWKVPQWTRYFKKLFTTHLRGNAPNPKLNMICALSENEQQFFWGGGGTMQASWSKLSKKLKNVIKIWVGYMWFLSYWSKQYFACFDQLLKNCWP